MYLASNHYINDFIASSCDILKPCKADLNYLNETNRRCQSRIIYSCRMYSLSPDEEVRHDAELRDQGKAKYVFRLGICFCFIANGTFTK